MKNKVVLGTRLLLGLIFVIFGSNGLAMIFTGSGFIPMPPSSPEMEVIMGGLFAAKYLMPTVKILQVISGILLLTNKLVPLALLFLAPIIYNILGLHIFIDISGLPIALILLVLISILFWDNKNKFSKLLE